jgi:hypothetical protein
MIAPGFGIGPAFGNGYGLEVSSTIDVSPGTVAGEPVAVAVDPRNEYVAGVFGIGEVDRGYLDYEGRFGGPLGWHGVREYERMYHTPAVGSSFNALRAAVLANGVNLLPAVKQKSSISIPGQLDGTGIEADLAAEICESNRRLLDAWETPVDLVMWEMMEDMYLGHVLAEIVAEDVTGGPDDGLLAIKALRPKPRGTYQFRVDRAFHVIGIRAAAIDPNGIGTEWKLFEPEKFSWSTWDSHRGDPRGRSCFRMAHYHWKLLMDLWPEVWKGWKQFGVPMLWGTTAQGGQQMVAVSDKNGQPKPGPGVTREYAMAMQIARMRNGDSGAGPFGSEIKVIESAKDSSVVSGAISILEGQIIRAILLQIRATTEAKHGSKADSETGQDILGTLVRFVRKCRERHLRSVLMRQNAWNYGDDIARRLTPMVDLGGTEHQDFAANSAGVAVLYQGGYFTASQLPYVDTFLGLPQRQPDDPRVGPTGIIPDTPPVEAAPKPEPKAGSEAA